MLYKKVVRMSEIVLRGLQRAHLEYPSQKDFMKFCKMFTHLYIISASIVIHIRYLKMLIDIIIWYRIISLRHEIK